MARVRSRSSPSRADWHVYCGTGLPGTADALAPPPRHRLSGEPVCEVPADDSGEADRRIGGVRGAEGVPSQYKVAMVNVAIYLRRPLLVTGRPGAGKSRLAYLVAREVGMGLLLRWPVTTRTALKDGLLPCEDRFHRRKTAFDVLKLYFGTGSCFTVLAHVTSRLTDAGLL